MLKVLSTVTRMSGTASILLLAVVAAGITETSAQAQCWTSQANINFLDGTRTNDTTLDGCQYSCQINPTCTGVDWNPASSDKCWMTFPGRTQNTVPGITHYFLSNAASCRLSATGSTQRITVMPTTPAPNPQLIDVAFLVDSSSRIGSSSNWELLKSFLNRIVDGLTIGQLNVQVAVITFSNAATVRFNLNSYLTATTVQSAINALSFENGAGLALSGALHLVNASVMTAANGARPTANKVAVLFTDGQESDPQTLVEAAVLRNASIRLLAVGLTSNVNTARLLSLIASQFDFYNASGFTGLDAALALRLSNAISYAGTPCQGSKCFENPCAREGLDCCGCECMDFASFQVCQCCPKDYTCCPYTPSVYGVSAPVCCPYNSNCNRQTDGSYRCSANDIQYITSVCESADCDPMYLSVTADRSINQLYMDGYLYSLQNASTWNAVDSIPMPADTRVIAASCSATTSSARAGLLASINNDYLLTNTSWKCTTSGQTGWKEKNFDDSSWPNAVISASGNSGLRPISTRSNWIWSSRYSSPNVDTQLYCRGRLPTNSCDVSYGGCSNLCALKGMVCCYCEMARAGPTKVCSCCPAGYHCCPFTPRDGDCNGDAGCVFTQPICCPNGYQCTSYGTCSTQGDPRPTVQKCSNCSPLPCIVTTPRPPSLNCSVDLAIIIDASDSIKPDNWNLVRNFAAFLANSNVLNVGPGLSRVACIVFSGSGEIRFNLSDDKSYVVDRLRTLGRLPQGTNLNDALLKLFEVFGPAYARPGIPKVAVIITDGVDNINETLTLATATRCKENGYYLVSVGVTPEIDRQRLETISSSSEVANFIPDFIQLNDNLATLVASQSCNQIASRRECVGIWIPSENTNTLGGIFVRSTNLTDCQDACMGNDTCTGIDWNPTEVEYKCWLSGPWNTNRRNGTAPGITHYDLVSKNCSNNSTTPSPTNSCTWTLTADTNYFGGVNVQSATSLAACRTSCLQYNGCTGIDWNRVANSGAQCYLSGSWTTGQSNTGGSPGIDHYDLARNPTGCSA